MTILKKTSLALITTIALGLASTAQADLIWDWTFIAEGYDPNPNSDTFFSTPGSGTITTEPLSVHGYQITGITGTFTDLVPDHNYGHLVSAQITTLYLYNGPNYLVPMGGTGYNGLQIFQLGWSGNSSGYPITFGLRDCFKIHDC